MRIEDLRLAASYLGIDPDTLPPFKSADSSCRGENMNLAGTASVGDLTDAEYELVRACLPPEPVSEDALPNSVILNALLWSRRSGRKLTQLPSRYGSAEAVRKRAERWAVARVWDQVLRELESFQLGDLRRDEIKYLCIVQIKRGERIRRSRRSDNN